MKVALITALAVSMACPAFSHSKTTMNKDNPLFDRCHEQNGVVVCAIKREHMECEPASRYNTSWRVFVDAKGLPEPIYQGKAVDPKLGPIGYMAFRMSDHYGHTYVYIVLEDVVCLGSIAHFPQGEPA